MTEPADERLLEIMLSEALGETTPPDVSAQVLAILEAGQDSSEQAPQIVAKSEQAKASRPWISFAVAASAIFAIAGYGFRGFIQPQSLQNGPNEVAERLTNNDTGHLTHASDTNDGASEPSPTERLAAAPRQVSEDFAIDVNDLPFGTAGDATAVEKKFATASPDANIKKLPAQQVVEELNELLTKAWQRLGIEPTEEISAAEHSNRLVTVLAGDATLSSQTIGDNGTLLEPSVDSLTAFVRSKAASGLGNRLAKYLLGSTAWNRLSKQQRVEATTFFAKNFAGEEAFDKSVFEMLVAKGSSAPKSQNFDPATIWLSGLAGTNSVPLTNQFCNVLLDIDVACSRCHHHPLERNIAQQDYWNLNAVFQTGVQWQIGGEGGLRIAKPNTRDHSKDAVFFESPDGRQLVATPATVDHWFGDSSQDTPVPTSLTQLAKKLQSSNQLAQATVNGLWLLVYGNRLVGRTSDPLSPPADEAFREAKIFLAEQLRANGYDLSTAVAWIAAAKPMRLESVVSSVDQESLTFTSEDIGKFETLERSFAAFSPRRNGRRFGDLVAMAEELNGGLTNIELAANRTVLGQVTEGAEKNTNGKTYRSTKLPAELRLTFPANSMTKESPVGWLESLANDKGFDEQAKHLFYVAGYSHVSESHLSGAKRIRDSSGNDSAALNQLWWAIKLSQSNL